MDMSKKASTIQENGQITLPADFRKRYGLKKGDLVVFKETEEGLLISPRESLAIKLLDEIGEALEEKGISLDELIESGREIRQEIYEQKYARNSDDE
jgi:AbrB family looped-hinge helix DNA binding protein